MEITLTNLQKKTINQRLLRNQARKILAHEQVLRGELSLVLVNDRLIKKINSQFLRRKAPTDVISFDLSPNRFPGSKKYFFGEIIISTDTAQKNARIFKTSFQHEMTLYLAHGILHLLGFDDRRPKEIKTMRLKEAQLLKLLKIE